VDRVRGSVPAELAYAVLFGSRARAEARADSDVDLLLIFHALPPDREPQATMAEAIAGDVARETAVPVTVWSVSLPDLERGSRTPMLVDALADAIPLWPRRPPPRVAFTRADAGFCVETLLLRVEEGGAEVALHRARGETAAAARRLRDDVVRLCTANLLLRLDTRPRFAGAVRAFEPLSGEVGGDWPAIAAWAIESFGATGKDEHAEVRPPPGGFAAACQVVERLRRRTAALLPRFRGQPG
jgi:hypothetical protein